MEPQHDLPRAEFAFPGPLRDALVAAILAGTKTATTSLLAAYERENEPLPAAGDRSLLIDSADRPVAVLEVTAAEVLPLGEVGWAHALDEGEGHASLAEWRAAHEEFWTGPQMRDALGDPAPDITDTTLVVAERFRVTERL